MKNMTGLKLKIDSDTISGVLNNGKTHLVLSGFKEWIGLDMVSAAPDKYIKWCSFELKEGAEFTVSLEDFATASHPIKVSTFSDSELVQMYNVLKTELEKKL